MKFSLIFFSGDERKKYRLVLDAAKLADENGFTAVWIPERHFHRFGGLYPNPSVVCSALAMVTKRIQLRAGSVIVPTHHVLRIAEEWSVVDNLSGGRVGVALATGFSPVDFAFDPGAWAERRHTTFERVETLRKLWRGEPISVRDGTGKRVDVELHPMPVQPELPLWLTCTKSTETFTKAGELGCNVLTGPIDMTLDDIGEKLKLYFDALDEHGHDRSACSVTMLLHTFIDDDLALVRERVREPFIQYLRSFFKVIDTQKRSLGSGALESVSTDDQRALLEYGFEKFFPNGSLLGTQETCAHVVERVRSMGVDEIACLIDFGLDDALVMKSLARVVELKKAFAGVG